MKRNDYYTITFIIFLGLFFITAGTSSLFESYLEGRIIERAVDYNTAVLIGNNPCYTAITNDTINFTCGGDITGLSVESVPIIPIGKYHRIENITGLTIDTWTDITWDTEVIEESTYGFTLTDDNTTISTSFEGIITAYGCIRAEYVGGAGIIGHSAMRIIVSNDDGLTWEESRCLQSFTYKSRQQDDKDTSNYAGTVKVQNNTLIKVQVQVSNTNIIFQGWDGFDNPVSASISLEYLSKTND